MIGDAQKSVVFIVGDVDCQNCCFERVEDAAVYLLVDGVEDCGDFIQF